MRIATALLLAAAPLVAAPALGDQSPLRPDGAVAKWAVAGPYAKDGHTFQMLMNVPFGPESADEGFEWRMVELPRGERILDLGALFGGPVECVFYLRAEVHSPEAQPARFDIGSDDGVRLWVNGEHIHANNAARGVTCGDDTATGALAEGPNDIVLKITQGYGGTGACLQILALDGTPLDGLAVAMPSTFANDRVPQGPDVDLPPPIWASERWIGDPHEGDWQGWLVVGPEDGEQERSRLRAQVINHGDGLFRMRLLREFDTRAPPVEVLAGVWHEDQGGPLRLTGGKWRAVSDGGVIQGQSVGMIPMQFSLGRVQRESPTLGAPPPEGAIVLFDGTGFDEWERRGRGSGPILWTLEEDGAMMVAPQTHNIQTRRVLRDFDLHIEWRSPYSPGNPHQFYGNSGVFFPGDHEIQVLNSYGSEGLINEAGGVYFIAPPLVNASYPPLSWQTYDVEFRAETDDAPSRITVRHNGVLVQDNLELPRTGAREGRLWLQDHHNQVQYRNIWIVNRE